MSAGKFKQSSPGKIKKDKCRTVFEEECWKYKER